MKCPVKTLIRIEERDDDQKPPIVYCTIPAWSPREVVRFSLDIVDKELMDHIRPGERFFAKVNIGAEDQSELFFVDFEYRGNIKSKN